MQHDYYGHLTVKKEMMLTTLDISETVYDCFSLMILD